MEVEWKKRGESFKHFLSRLIVMEMGAEILGKFKYPIQLFRHRLTPIVVVVYYNSRYEFDLGYAGKIKFKKQK